MYVYLAHPLDQAAGGSARPMVQVVASVLEAGRQQGVSFFMPGTAHRLPPQPWNAQAMGTVDRINRQSIWEADALLAILPPGVPTLGVPSEIEHALMLNRPTAIVTTERLRASSIQLASWANRGAQFVFAGEDGNLQGLNLRELLGSLPNPTLLVSDEDETQDWTPPNLQVKYTQAANQTLSQGKYEGDAGIDLGISGEQRLAPGEYRLMPTAAHVAIPHGYFGLITGRSSTWAKYRCDVRHAVIDSGYRGELMVGIENRGDQWLVFESGTRLAQIVLLPTFGGQLEVVDELPAAERGEAGYGSSGVR